MIFALSNIFGGLHHPIEFVKSLLVYWFSNNYKLLFIYLFIHCIYYDIFWPVIAAIFS